MLPAKPTAEQIRERRERREYSIFEAKADAWQEWRRECLRQLQMRSVELNSVESCRGVVADVIELLIAVEYE